MLVDRAIAREAEHDARLAVEHLDAALEKKALTLSRMLAVQVSSAVAFADVETAREAFLSAQNDDDIAGLSLTGENGRVLFALGAVPRFQAAFSDNPVVRRDDTHLTVVHPVVSNEGPKGVLLVALSTQNVRAQARNVLYLALGCGLGGVLIGCIAALLLGTSLGRRITAVTAQAEICFENIRTILAEAGLGLADIVRINAFVTEREHMKEYMAVRDRYVSDPPPASTLVIVSGFTRPEFLVEVEVVAAGPA